MKIKKKRGRRLKSNSETICVEFSKFVNSCTDKGFTVDYVLYVSSGLSIGLLRKYLPFGKLSEVITTFLQKSHTAPDLT